MATMMGPLQIDPKSEAFKIILDAVDARFTLRDYFAAAALQTLTHMVKDCDVSLAETADAAYAIADAMLRARGRD